MADTPSPSPSDTPSPLPTLEQRVNLLAQTGSATARAEWEKLVQDIEVAKRPDLFEDIEQRLNALSMEEQKRLEWLTELVKRKRMEKAEQVSRSVEATQIEETQRAIEQIPAADKKEAIAVLPETPARPEESKETWFPRTTDYQQWTNKQLVMTSLTGIGIGYLAYKLGRKLWHWMRSKPTEEPTKKEKTSTWKWLLLIPVLGAVGFGIYKGHEFIRSQSAWYRDFTGGLEQQITNLKQQVNKVLHVGADVAKGGTGLVEGVVKEGEPIIEGVGGMSIEAAKALGIGLNHLRRGEWEKALNEFAEHGCNFVKKGGEFFVWWGGELIRLPVEYGKQFTNLFVQEKGNYWEFCEVAASFGTLYLLNDVAANVLLNGTKSLQEYGRVNTAFKFLTAPLQVVRDVGDVALTVMHEPAAIGAKLKSRLPVSKQWLFGSSIRKSIARFQETKSIDALETALKRLDALGDSVTDVTGRVKRTKSFWSYGVRFTEEYAEKLGNIRKELVMELQSALQKIDTLPANASPELQRLFANRNFSQESFLSKLGEHRYEEFPLPKEPQAGAGKEPTQPETPTREIPKQAKAGASPEEGARGNGPKQPNTPSDVKPQPARTTTTGTAVEEPAAPGAKRTHSAPPRPSTFETVTPEEAGKFVEQHGDVGKAIEEAGRASAAERAAVEATNMPKPTPAAQAAGRGAESVESVTEGLSPATRKLIETEAKSAAEASELARGASALAKIGVGVDALLLTYEAYSVMQMWREVAKLEEAQGLSNLIAQAAKENRAVAWRHTESLATSAAASTLFGVHVLTGTLAFVATGAGAFVLIALPVGMAIRAGMYRSLADFDLQNSTHIKDRIEGYDEIALGKPQYEQLREAGAHSLTLQACNLFSSKELWEGLEAQNQQNRENIIVGMMLRQLRDTDAHAFEALMKKLGVQSPDHLSQVPFVRQILLPFIGDRFVTLAQDERETNVKINADPAVEKSIRNLNIRQGWLNSYITEGQVHRAIREAALLCKWWAQQPGSVEEKVELPRSPEQAASNLDDLQVASMMARQLDDIALTSAIGAIHTAFGKHAAKLLTPVGTSKEKEATAKAELIALRQEHASILVDINYAAHTQLQRFVTLRQVGNFAVDREEGILLIRTRLDALNAYLEAKYHEPKLQIEPMDPKEAKERGGVSPAEAFWKAGRYHVTDVDAAKAIPALRPSVHEGTIIAEQYLQTFRPEELQQKANNSDWLNAAVHRYRTLLNRFE